MTSGLLIKWMSFNTILFQLNSDFDNVGLFNVISLVQYFEHKRQICIKMRDMYFLIDM